MLHTCLYALYLLTYLILGGSILGPRMGPGFHRFPFFGIPRFPVISIFVNFQDFCVFRRISRIFTFSVKIQLPPPPAPESFINVIVSWCFWGAPFCETNIFVKIAVLVKSGDFHGNLWILQKFMISMKMMILQEMAPQKPQYSYRNTMVSRTGGEKDQIFMKTWKSVCHWFLFIGVNYSLYFFTVLCRSGLSGPDARILYKRNLFLVFLRCVPLEILHFTEITDLHIFIEFYGIPWNSQKNAILIQAATSAGAARAPETIVFL